MERLSFSFCVFDVAFVLSVFLLYLCLHCLMQGEEMKRQVLLDRDLKPLLALQSTYNIPQCDNYLSQLLNIQLDKYRCLHSTILQKGTKIGFNFICLCADLKFVKKFTRPNFRAKEFYTMKMRKSRLFSPAINSKNSSLSVIWPSFG